jgi:hypothetical protein
MSGPAVTLAVIEEFREPTRERRLRERGRTFGGFRSGAGEVWVTSTYQYDLFLSHSSCDKQWVERLGSDLEAQTVGERRIRVFLDVWDIPYGANIPLRLEEALTKSAFVAVVMTPEMLTSEWCKAEWSSQLHKDPTRSPWAHPPRSGCAMSRWTDTCHRCALVLTDAEVFRLPKGERLQAPT